MYGRNPPPPPPARASNTCMNREFPMWKSQSPVKEWPIPSYLFALKCRTKLCLDHTAVLKFLLRSTLLEELRSFRPNVYLSDGVSCGLLKVDSHSDMQQPDTKLCNRVNIIIRGGILVKTVRYVRVRSLSFHAYRNYSIKRRRWKQDYQ